MSILIDRDTPLLIQGMTGRIGRQITLQMLSYGTNVVAGVTPGRGGEWFDGKPIFDTVTKAVEATGAFASVIAVPAPHVLDAVIEAVDAGLKTIICLTRHTPVHDTMRMLHYIEDHSIRLLGPGSPGILVPGQVTAGVIPAQVTTPGKVAVIARSTTLMYALCYVLSRQGLGQSVVAGVGSDRVIGMGFVDLLEMLEADIETERILLVGEMAGEDEIEAARFVHKNMTKPVVAFIVGRSYPPGLVASTPLESNHIADGLAIAKIERIQSLGIRVAQHPDEITGLLQQ